MGIQLGNTQIGLFFGEVCVVPAGGIQVAALDEINRWVMSTRAGSGHP
jgi:hypothetical protein